MADAPHIAIIGAGLIGLSTADSLVRRGARVTVYDRHPGPARGTSFSNSAMVHPSQARPWAVEGVAADAGATRTVRDLALRSAPRIRAKLAEFGQPVLADGCEQVFATAAARDTVRAALIEAGIAALARSGFAGKPALFFPDDFAADAHLYGLAMAEELRSRGVDLHYGMTVLPGDVDADVTLIAAGPQSAALAAHLGVDLPLLPVAGHALDFARPDIARSDIVLPDHPVMDAASRSALTVFADRVRLSGSVGLAHPDQLLPLWRGLAPDLVAALGDPLRRWTGERPVSATGAPLCEAIAPGIWVNTGHGHMGWTCCAGAGEALAERLLPSDQGV